MSVPVTAYPCRSTSFDLLEPGSTPFAFRRVRLYFDLTIRFSKATMNRSRCRCCFATCRAAVLVSFSALCGVSAHADEKARNTAQFDGLWQTTLSCENSNGALGYSFRFPSTIKNGVLHGDKGTAHEAGWLQIDGSIASDGAADLYVDGLVGATAAAVGRRPAGTSYGYHVAARFSADRAEGHRVEGRRCTVMLAREK